MLSSENERSSACPDSPRRPLTEMYGYGDDMAASIRTLTKLMMGRDPMQPK